MPAELAKTQKLESKCYLRFSIEHVGTMHVSIYLKDAVLADSGIVRSIDYLHVPYAAIMAFSKSSLSLCLLHLTSSLPHFCALRAGSVVPAFAYPSQPVKLTVQVLRSRVHIGT